MKLFKGSTPRRANAKPVKPRFIWARGVLLAVTVCIGAFTVVQWAVPFWETDPAYAVFLGAVFGTAALVVPYLSGLVARSHGLARAGLVIACVAFGALDWFGLDQGLKRLEAQLTARPYAEALKAHTAARQPLLDALTGAQAKLDAVTLDLSDNPGPLTTEARTATWKEQRAELKPAVTAATAALETWDKAHPDPVRPDLFDDLAIGIACLGIQLALAFGFASIEATREHVYRKAMADYQAGRKKTKTKAQPKPKAEPKPEIPRVKEPGPRFAFPTVIEGGKAVLN